MITPQTTIRLSEKDRATLHNIAKDLGYSYNGEGSLSLMLRAIAENKLEIVAKK